MNCRPLVLNFDYTLELPVKLKTTNKLMPTDVGLIGMTQFDVVWVISILKTSTVTLICNQVWELLYRMKVLVVTIIPVLPTFCNI